MNTKAASPVVWAIVCFCTASASAVFAHYAEEWVVSFYIAAGGAGFGAIALLIALGEIA